MIIIKVVSEHLQDADLAQLSDECGVSEKVLARIRDDPDYMPSYDDITRVRLALDIKITYTRITPKKPDDAGLG